MMTSSLIACILVMPVHYRRAEETRARLTSHFVAEFPNLNVELTNVESLSR